MILTTFVDMVNHRVPSNNIWHLICICFISQILPCEYVDTPTLRYLNSDFVPLRHPSANKIDIESLKTSWLDDKPLFRSPGFSIGQLFVDTSTKKAKPLSDTVIENQLLRLSDDYNPATEKLLESSTSYNNDNN